MVCDDVLGMGTRTRYPTDLTDEQWHIIEPMIPPEKHGGRHRTVDMREVINAILYILRTGCQWRNLPHDFPPWGTVHYLYRLWRIDGTWQKIHRVLTDRLNAADKLDWSRAIIDSSSVRAA